MIKHHKKYETKIKIVKFLKFLKKEVPRQMNKLAKKRVEVS